jgi:hypothetical protein
MEPNPSDRNMSAVARDSVVQIRYLLHLGPGVCGLLHDVNAHSKTVRSRNRQSVRNGKGDHGSMHPVGTRISLDGKHRTRYVTSSDGKSLRTTSSSTSVPQTRC